MAAVMDLDLNCSPLSPEPASQEDRRSMLRQQLAFRDQDKDLHRLYWTRNNLTDVPSFWNHSSDGLPYARHPHHPSHMVDLGATHNPGVFRHCHELDKQAPCHDEATWENWDVKGSILRKHSPCSVQGRSSHLSVIDLEKPVTLDDEVEIVSSPAFINYANHNGGLLDHSHSVPRESSSLMHDQLCGAPYVSSGSTGGYSGTVGSHLPARAKNAVSGGMGIDLNVAQEDDSSICPEPSKVLCSLVASSTTRHSGDFTNNSSKKFLKGSESSIGPSKESSITVATTISPYSSREVMVAGALHDTGLSYKPLCVEASKHNPLAIRNIHHVYAQHMISQLDSQCCIEKTWKLLSASSNGENISSLGLPKLGGSQGTNLMEQPATVAHREHQAESITVISDDEVEGFDLNVSVESIDFPSKVTSCGRSKYVNANRSEENSSKQYVSQNEVRQDIPSVECATIKDQHSESRGCEDLQSSGCGTASDRCVFIPKTPQGRDYASPRLRSSSNGVSIPAHETEVGKDEKSAAMAAETLVSIFVAHSEWMADSHGSNSETYGEDRSHEPAPSLNSFEESILCLEEMKDDGESSVLVRPLDKDGPCCGIKLKRGRGLRDFQREILPGLVSLARHEVCDDLHAIGHEIRKTRSRRSSGDEGTHPTRARLPRRCSTAWHRDL